MVFIDLTRSDRPSEVDIYLCAKNWFYFGSSSGPLSLAYQFGRPSLLIDFSLMAQLAQIAYTWQNVCKNKRSTCFKFQEIERMDLQTVWF